MLNIDPIDTHARVWARIQPVLDKHRLPHALLLVGPRHVDIESFANRLMGLLLCQKAERAPCGLCQPCRLLMQGTHPDIQYVRQDTPNGPLKIEQIRDLQHNAYQTPQLGMRRFIVIEPVDKLNVAAANALLKILEEPPSHTTFILIAEQTSTLPATIMSRCQQYAFSSCQSPDEMDYWAIGNAYPDDSTRGEIFKQRDSIMAVLRNVASGKMSPCTAASQWSGYALGDLLWFLHLLTAQAIQDHFIVNVQKTPAWSLDVAPEVLFQQLDRLNALMRSVQQNITLNQMLAIEGFLMGFNPLCH